EAVGVVGFGHEPRDAEMARGLVRGVVPGLAAVLPGQGGQQRPGFAVVATLEDARCLDSDEQAVARTRERRHLGDLATVVVPVCEALARVLPRLAEVFAPENSGAVPFAR